MWAKSASQHWVFVILFALSAGCGGDSKGPRAGQAQAQAGVEAPVEAPVEAEARTSSTPPSEPESKAVRPASAPGPAPNPQVEASHELLTRAQRAALSRALARGRKAADTKDWAKALEHFLAGIEVYPEHARLHCEAGWAAYQLEDPRARELLHAGVRLARDDRPLQATCLHNLARWHERAGHDEEAIAHYADSLALRPDNTVTRSRYRKLSGQDPALVALDCPPSGRFASVGAFCQALVANEPKADAEIYAEAECRTRALDAPVEGPALGELVRVELDHDGGPYWPNYLLVRVGDELEVLGRLGTSVGRSCSTGYTEIDRVRWLDPDRLVFELHRSGEYSCMPTPYETCSYEAENAGKPVSVCDGVSDEWKPEITDDHPRMICRRIDGAFRCSVPPEYYSDALDPASELPEVPEGASFDALLVCPPVLRTRPSEP